MQCEIFGNSILQSLKLLVVQKSKNTFRKLCKMKFPKCIFIVLEVLETHYYFIILWKNGGMGSGERKLTRAKMENSRSVEVWGLKMGGALD